MSFDGIAVSRLLWKSKRPTLFMTFPSRSSEFTIKMSIHKKFVKHITQKSAKNHRNKNDGTKSRQNVQFYSFCHPIHVQTSVRFKMLYVYRAFMSKLYAIQAFRLGLISKTER